jgi:hypothetical protein
VDDSEGGSFHGPIEKFCDLVANYTQFPSDYVNSVFNAIRGRSKATKIRLLKDYSSENSHSMFGIAERLKDFMPIEDHEIGRANTNLKKKFPTIGDILFKGEDSREYIERLKKLSPLFIDIVLKQIDNATTRKVGEWLGLESSLDAKQVIEELRKTGHDTDFS